MTQTTTPFDELIVSDAITHSSRAGGPLASGFGEVINACRALLDDVRVQADLARMGLRSDVSTRCRVGENAWLAARTHLDHALYDATHGTAVYNPPACVVRDLRRAADAVSAVIRRG